MRIRVDFDNEKYEDEPESFFSSLEITELHEDPRDTWMESMLTLMSASVNTRESIVANCIGSLDVGKIIDVLYRDNKEFLAGMKEYIDQKFEST